MNKKPITLINKTRPKVVSIDNITGDFTKEDWQAVENEKKYYQLVVSLRNLRQEIGLTQKELSEKANLPRATVVKVESGRRNTTLETLMHMAQAMGKDLVVGLQ
ncbi:MAG: helix-turn-helix transcriptional regulator [Patescibacteria group bacterium]